MEIPFIAFLVQGIPETIATAAVVYILAASKIKWGPVIKTGLCQALLLYFIRLLPLTPYTHVVISIPSLAIFTTIFGRIDIRKAQVYSIIAIFILFVCETAIMFGMNALQIVTYQQVETNIISRILMGIPHVLILYGLAYAIERYKHKVVWEKDKIVVHRWQ